MSTSHAPVDPNERIEVSVMVRPRRPLDELDARLNQPGAAVLSREEFAATYGADPADVAKVEAFARQHGLEVVESSPARRTVRLAGTAADISSVFGVEFFQDTASDGGTFRGYTGSVQIPPELQGIVEGVFGLDTHPIARPRSTW
jgi:kumamolisin